MPAATYSSSIDDRTVQTRAPIAIAPSVHAEPLDALSLSGGDIVEFPPAGNKVVKTANVTCKQTLNKAAPLHVKVNAVSPLKYESAAVKIKRKCYS